VVVIATGCHQARGSWMGGHPSTVLRVLFQNLNQFTRLNVPHVDLAILRARAQDLAVGSQECWHDDEGFVDIRISLQCSQEGQGSEVVDQNLRGPAQVVIAL